jgi:hypothetical protein
MADEKDTTGAIPEAKQPAYWSAENAHNFPGWALPALYSNRFQVVVGPAMTRVIFGESLFGEDGSYKSAIAMTTADAVELARLILKIVDDQNAAAEQAAKDEQKVGQNA